MALIPVPIAGQLIDPAAYGGPVANILNQRAENITFVPGGNLDTAAGTAVWITVGNLTVPAWAAKCMLAYSINNTLVGTAFGGAEDFTIQAKIGTDAGRAYVLNSVIGTKTGTNDPISINDLVTITSTGVKSLTIVTTRIAGTGSFRVGTRSHITVNAIYLP